MQRTYKSKKDTGGGLDPREVIFSLDDKSSAFDAFYIQNIKQTKREHSCMSSSNQYSSAANKVRKRKYVRRIVKEVERIPEYTSKSSYLTPDKSIHVNRGQDLFDQLLNSSSPTGNETIKTNKNDLFDKLKLSKEKNTYSRKKITKTRIKKINYSSSDSTDSDKENSSETKSQNATNIGKHELVIEREPKKSSPYCQDQDDSINHIANLSIINKMSDSCTPKNYKSNNYGNNRLTEHLIPNQNSPLCSTPFMEKYRGKSIYKFSPISMGKLDESNTHNTDHTDSNEKDKSVVLFDSNEMDSLVVSNNIHVPSPVLKCTSKSMFNNSSSHSNVSRRKKNSNNSLINNSIHKEDRDEAVKEDIKNNIDSLIQYSTDVTPFLGFVNNTLKHEEDPEIILVDNEIETEINTSPRKSLVLQTSTKNNLFKRRNDSKASNSSSEKSYTSVKSNKSVKITNITFEEDFLPPSNIDTNQMSIEDEPFLGFSTNTILKAEEIIDVDKSYFDSEENSSNDITMVESEIPKQIDEIETENKLSISIEDNSCNEDKFMTFSTTRKTVATESIIESDSDGQSHYDTCDSLERFSEEEKCEPKTIIPLVVLERMNLSNFEKHRNKNASDSSSSSSNNSSAEISYTDKDTSSKEVEESTDTDTESNISSQTSSTGTESFINEESNESKEEIEELATQTSGSQSNEEEERNFVTKRRRNDAVNNSSLLVLDETTDNINTSTSTDEANTTVLHKLFNKNRPGKRVTEDLISEVLSRDDVTESYKSLVKNFRMSVADRNASRIAEHAHQSNKATGSGLHSISHDVSKLGKTVMEPAIVLQPGKKWERSLSIYRRMTTMSTCDGSVLEDDELDRKGRKYRQSVIETMEMQPHKGPLHNESFQSCRSSIVSKPHRATIKIIKDPNSSNQSHHSSSVLNDLSGFLHEDCDDTVVELSKLSISGPELEVTIVENVHESERLTTAREFVLRRCNQTEPILFDECYPDTVLKNCHKIGEGVYGEVYLWKARDGRARVMKVVPIAGSTKVNGEHQKDFHEVISEIVIAMELSALRAPIADIENHLDEGKDIASLDLHSIENATDCFNEVLAVRCVYGSYPSRLLDLWDLFDECKGSENDNPAVLPADQQFLVLELANAGQDLESYQFTNAEQAHALFMQVAFALAVGEEAFQFEHRDLHWGNVLIAPTEQKYATFVLRGRSYRLPRRGVAATIIDYSLSRAALPVAGDRVALYNDLGRDEELFAAVGDKQFDVYRSMREHTGNDWKVFEPYTNILWLEYVADKMITALRYKRVNTKVHKHYIAKLKGIKDRILTHRSAVQFVLTDDEF